MSVLTGVETARVLAVIAAVHPGFTVSPFQQKIWHELLEDLDYPDVSLALKEILRESPYVPTPAALIEKARVVRLLRGGDRDWQWLKGGEAGEQLGDADVSGTGAGDLPAGIRQ